MFLKACHALRVLLLALVAQIGNLAKIGIRKGYDDKNGIQRKIRQVDNNLKQEVKWRLKDQSRLALDDPSNYKLGLVGKLEPVSNLPTINLSNDLSTFRMDLDSSKSAVCQLCGC